MSRPIILYGIPNCDQVKKARAWLAAQSIDYVFQDFKKGVASRTAIEEWLTIIPMDKLINRKGTTWRGLTDVQRASASDVDGAIELMIQHPSLIKRPIFRSDEVILAGFDPDAYRTALE